MPRNKTEFCFQVWHIESDIIAIIYIHETCECDRCSEHISFQEGPSKLMRVLIKYTKSRKRVVCA